MKKLLICGDSFAADWTVKFSGQGWPNKLAQNFSVVNLARAGVGQYKIYQQLCSQKLDTFDAVIISHTSPFRIYVKQHPLHYKDALHGDCDLIYSDLKAQENQFPEIKCITKFFENFYDQDHAKFIHSLICEKIENICENFSSKVIHLINFKEHYNFKNSLNFLELFESNRGSMNHFDEQGNKIVFDAITKKLNEIIQ